MTVVIEEYGGNAVLGSLWLGLPISVDSLLPNFESKSTLMRPSSVRSKKVIVMKAGPADPDG
jgi:hypothetical protein